MTNKLRYGFLAVMLVFLAACTHQVATETVSSNMAAASKINVQLGIAYLKEGDNLRAKEKLLLAVSQDKTPQSYGALAYYYEKTGDITSASQNYQAAIVLNPVAGAGHNNYGAFLCRQGEYQQADEQFMLAVNDKNYINTAGAYENAGLCALLIPDKAKAKQYFEIALQQNPELSVARNELATLNNQ
jgi:type IV pilus assembly protein PilF